MFTHAKGQKKVLDFIIFSALKLHALSKSFPCNEKKNPSAIAISFDT